MTTPILFLLGAVALSALGGLVVWIGSRPRPERFGSTIDTFSRDLDALAPPGRERNSQPASRMNPSDRTRRPASARPAASSQARTPQPVRSGQPGARPRPGPRPAKQTERK